MSDLFFYFAWVDPTDSVWDSSFARNDEHPLSLVIDHEEGQIPKLTVEVKNPRVGFLAPGRKYWAWLSYGSGGGLATPLFFGRLVGIPTNILANVVQMEFTARPTDYIRQKQLVAEGLKVLPYYDPVFVEVAKRDDPDTILEGWSALYHVDRFGLVTSSDILLGEDGTVSFHVVDVPYDSVKMKLLQAPLKAVTVKAEVSWLQQCRGHFVAQPSISFPTLGNDAFVSDWPKSGGAIGPGYAAGVAWAGERDPSLQQTYLSSWTGNYQEDFEWRNYEKEHETGDTMSISMSTSYPITAMAPNFIDVFLPWASFQQNGLLDPANVDSNGDPDPINIPAIVDYKYFCYRQFDLSALGKFSSAFLSVTYDASRQRTERLDLTLVADVQPILIDPLITEDTETISVKSGDLSLPLIDFLNWDSVSGRAVTLGETIFPDNPVVPGQTSAQIATVAGIAGTVEPIFSNIAGVTTTDGTVVWTSLGQSAPTEMAQDWSGSAPVALGTMIIPKPVTGVPDRSSLLAAGSMNYPPTGVPVSRFAIISEGFAGPGSTMYECTAGGILGGLSIEQAQFETFKNPTGMHVYICVRAGKTGLYHRTFHEAVGATTADGTVVWQNVGLASLPIGGYPGHTPRASYFPSGRGQLSLQNMIMRARAKLRKRARAVEVNFDVRFEAAAGLSCRMNAGIADLRLPGGQAYGKVIGYKLTADGDTGRVYANVTLGCSIGNYWPGNPETPPIVDTLGFSPAPTYDPGTQTYVSEPTYVKPGYVKPGYQKYAIAVAIPPIIGGGIASPIGDWPPVQPGPFSTDPSPPPLVESAEQVGYTPPIQQTVDDGIVFPAHRDALILSNRWHGVPSTLNPGNIAAYNLQIQEAIYEALRDAMLHPYIIEPPPPQDGFQSIDHVIVDAPDWGAIDFQVQNAVLNSVYQGTGLWYELALRPLDAGPFAAAYVVATTPLYVPKTIDLSASSI